MKSTDKIPVLIVDDRPENLSSLEALLGDMELELVKAQSGNEALRHILYNDFALVLLDVQMPEMDGFETATLMRENPKTRHLPIIFVTAGMKEEYHQFRGYEAGAVDYLMKPIEPHILRSKVRVFCDLYAQRQEMKRMKEELEQQNEKLRQTYEQLQQETAERLRAVDELRQKDQIMIQQSRIAAMGEMLNNIAHQWRQPLNVLGLKIQEIGFFYDYGELSKDFLDTSIGKAMEVLRHLSQTIDDFRDFSSPDKEKTVFDVEQVVGKTLSLVAESFAQRGIAIDVSISESPRVNGYPNEYRQVLLNILMNSKDAFAEQAQQEPRVAIRSWSEHGKTVLTITDNAGGIPDEHLNKIFDAYYTTKDLGKGTGIGLFMAKNIIEKNMGGSLTARNIDGGAEFRIET
jgi:C4-dicarboxylate-specific signal transduction histidine kinase